MYRVYEQESHSYRARNSGREHKRADLKEVILIYTVYTRYISGVLFHLEFAAMAEVATGQISHVTLHLKSNADHMLFKRHKGRDGRSLWE